MLAWLLCLAIFVDCNHATPYVSAPARPVAPTTRELVARLILIGDAGANPNDSPLLLTLEKRASLEPERTQVVFLGDNIYPDGLVAEDAPGYAEARRRLLNQIEAVAKSGAEYFFVPGNHDWARGAETGLANVERSAQFISKYGGPRGKQLPEPGTPGPHCLDRPGVRLVFIDTQWFLHLGPKSDPGGAERAFTAIQACAAASDRHVVVVGHHPMHSLGLHGGFYTLRQHIFPLTDLVSWLYLPLPIIGSLYPAVCASGVSPQDLSHTANLQLVKGLRGALGQSRALLYAAGHEHNLQLHESPEGPRYTVVSGSGSTTSPVGDDARTLYAQSSRGFMELEIFEDGRADLSVIAQADPDEADAELAPIFRVTLAESF
ncbi:MAG: hypothetical protein RJA70_2134 [Pseudomonadota bacterium]|jgi:hypothetical protein